MSDEIKIQGKNKKTKLIVAIAAAVIAIVTIVAIAMMASGNATAKRVEEQLSLGEKYLSKLQYEQAIAAYELAIEIDPKCEEAYLALAEIYIETGEFEKAEEILDKAEEALGEETEGIKELREKMEKERGDAEVTPSPKPTATPEPKPTVTPEPTPNESVRRTGTLDMISYEVIDEKEVKINGISDKTVTDIMIPDTIEGLPVTVIGNGAFRDCTELLHIDMPESIKRIESMAFFDCYNLEEVEFPSGIYEVGFDAFAYCSSLKNVFIPASVSSLGEGVFRGCNNLLEIQVTPENNSYISVDGVLYSNDRATLLQYPAGKEATEYTIPEGVTRIGLGAFEWAHALELLHMPESLEGIADIAFSGCDSLSELYIPRNVKSFEGEIGINSCFNLNKIEVASGNEYFTVVEQDLYSKDMTELIAVLPTKNLEGYQIASGVLVIKNGAFGHRSLNKIQIPDNVNRIERYAFSSCSELEEVIISANTTVIEEEAFAFCNKVTIYTTAGSYAETYAKENNIPVVIQ